MIGCCRWRARLLELLDTEEELGAGLARAREVVELKYLEKWRRSAL